MSAAGRGSETGRSSQNSCWGSGRAHPQALPGAESFAKQGVAKLNSLPKVYEGFNEL